MFSTKLDEMVTKSIFQDNPIEALLSFLDNETRHETSRDVEKMHFIGYVLELGYDTAKIITSDTYKLIVGGIPRGSFLIMTPNDYGKLPPHFSLLRVKGTSTTPLSSQVQQTYFELHKKSMPELDIWTQNELQWGALECDVLGMFYPDSNDSSKLSFSGDVNNIVSAHKYKVYAPDSKLLEIIVNGLVPEENRFELGTLRTMECLLNNCESLSIKIPVYISMNDFKGRRTAMFGKTRLGKSNVVKLIAQGMIDATKDSSADETVGQLIFDINGEYANDNPQDGNHSLRSANEDRCVVYALTPRVETPSKTLRLNFYEFPDSAIRIIESKLAEDGHTSNYIRSFSSVVLPNIDEINKMENYDDKIRAVRKIMIFWAILDQANFGHDDNKLKNKLHASHTVKNFDPHFNKNLRNAVYNNSPIPEPNSIESMRIEIENIARFKNQNPNDPVLFENGKSIFDAEDKYLLEFLVPIGTLSSGSSVLRSCINYHSKNAGKFNEEIIEHLEKGKTVILDLGNETDTIRKFFSDMLSNYVFRSQENKFVTNTLKRHFVQLYFEEAHNLFPINDKDITSIYARFAKEGAKFHIGMVYSTQSPSTINKELLAQTENFFVGHLSSQDEANSLTKLQVAFDGVEQDIMRSKTPGFMRMLTMSNRFVIPAQAKLFNAVVE